MMVISNEKKTVDRVSTEEIKKMLEKLQWFLS